MFNDVILMNFVVFIQVTSVAILAPSKELCKQIAACVRQITELCKWEVRYIDISPTVPLEAQKTLFGGKPLLHTTIYVIVTKHRVI